MPKQGWPLYHGAPVEKLPPQQLEVEPVGGVVRNFFTLVTKNGVGHRARRERAIGQPGGERTGATETIEVIPRLLVVGNRMGLKEELIKASQPCRGAAGKRQPGVG